MPADKDTLRVSDYDQFDATAQEYTTTAATIEEHAGAIDSKLRQLLSNWNQYELSRFRQVLSSFHEWHKEQLKFMNQGLLATKELNQDAETSNTKTFNLDV